MRAAIDGLAEPCVVVGSRPSVPVEGMEEALAQKVHWVDAGKPTAWRELGLPVPQVYMQSGWAYPAFSALGREVKAAGGHVIGMSDANWRGDFRQFILGAAAFRLWHRRQFDAMLVPGAEGARLLRWFGMPSDRIRIGMYGADPTLFGGGGPLANRPPVFLFVGQFIARKDVLGVARAFLAVAHRLPEWRLSIIGGGEQRGQIPSHPRITVEDFVQPERLAEHFRAARFFVLPSLAEAWGLVVHEAALCGCGLILSDRIGSAADLGASANSVRFRAGSVPDLAGALLEAATFGARRLEAAEAQSRSLAAGFGPERFAAEVVEFCHSLRAGG
jgi:glycosyltransferase involved in cell wall biosynthesis